MKVTFVGTSCTWYTRNNTSFILDDNMLFDVSAGNYKHIIKYIDIFNLNAIFISHWHFDHLGDLNIITTRFIRESERNGRTEKLRVYCKNGTAERIIAQNTLFLGSEDEKDIDLLKKYVDFIDIDDGFEFDESGYHIKVYRVDHGKVECFGFTFEDLSTHKVYAFSGDTRWCENLENMLSISNVAFVDMAAAKEFPSHLSVEKFIELSKKYSNCKMVPIHTSDQSLKLGQERGLEIPNDGDIIEY